MFVNYSRCGRHLFLFTAFTLGVIISPNLSAKNGELFGITSFIPSRFTDTEWRVNGQTDFAYIDNDASAQNGASYLDQDGKFWESYGRLAFNSYFRYRNETIPRNINITTDGRVTYDWSKRHDISNTIVPDSALQYRSTDRRQRNYSIAIRPAFSLIQYLRGNLFASIGINVATYYSKRPVNKYFMTESNIRHIADQDLIREYSGVDDYHEESDEKSYYFATSLNAGRGRLYVGYYGATTLYLIEELNAKGLLNQEPDYDQMRQLCEIIYQNRNKHGVDSRIRQIESLKGVIDYLKNEALISDDGPMAYLIIQDVWNYFPRYPREFGLLFQGGIKVAGEYLSRQSGSTRYNIFYDDFYSKDSVSLPGFPQSWHSVVYYYNHDVNKYTNLSAEAKIVYARPFNLRWQLDATSVFSYFLYSKRKISSDFRDQDTNGRANREETFDEKGSFAIKTDGSLRYIIDSRSNLLGTTKLWFTHFEQKNTGDGTTDNKLEFTEEEKKDNTWQLQLSIEYLYRISIPTALMIKILYGDIWMTNAGDTHSQNSQFAISAGISHYIF